MPALSSPRRRWLWPVLAVLSFSVRGRAADGLHECIAAHSDGQLLRNQGQLVAAKARFAACLNESCPALVRDDCAAFAAQVEAALPSVVLMALDESGQPAGSASVSIDGSAPLSPLDGKALVLDPGPHRFHFVRADGVSRDVELSLAEGQREQRVTADFRPPLAAASARSANGVGTAIWVSGGVAALALGSFSYFALAGRGIQSDLESCKPNCEHHEDYDRMRARYLVADVSLSVALVSAGVGAYLWLTHPNAFARSAAQRAPAWSMGVSSNASSSGVGLWARGEF